MTDQTSSETIRFLLGCMHDKENAASALYNVVLSAATFLCAENDKTFERFKANVELLKANRKKG